jgi:very-short-patch-repair endonuclease
MPALIDTYSTSNVETMLSKALKLAGVKHLENQCLHGYYLGIIFPGHKLIVEVDSNTYSGNSYKKTRAESLQ